MTTLMAADDPRHGQRRGYYAHRRENSPACGACKRAAAAAEARYVMLRNRGVTSRLNPIGTQRRLRALVALGYTWRALDGHLGYHNMAEKWGNQNLRYVFPSTHAKVAEVYERLSMTLPPNSTSVEKAAVSKAQGLARRKGWPPPLAWSNIDDPNETPTGWQRTEPRGGGWSTPGRHDELDDLLDRGVGISEVCRVLDVTATALEKWTARHGRRDDFRRFVDRERGAA